MRTKSLVPAVLLAAFAVAALPLAGCASHAAAPAASADMATEAVARVYPTDGNHAAGVVRFTAIPGGLHIVAELTGLTPNGMHAFHVHQFGDATSADGTSAGGHYNPANHPHGAPDPSMHHAGDLGNVQADANGNAHHVMDVMGLSISGPMNAVVGRSVILHAGHDDFTTQPTGNAGGRIGCGVIGIAKPAQ